MQLRDSKQPLTSDSSKAAGAAAAAAKDAKGATSDAEVVPAETQVCSVLSISKQALSQQLHSGLLPLHFLPGWHPMHSVDHWTCNETRQMAITVLLCTSTVFTAVMKQSKESVC